MTNVLKHSGPGTQASVELVYDRSELRVSIVDDGRGRGTVARIGAPPLLSKRRVTDSSACASASVLHGGEFNAITVRGSGFHVTATFPLPATAPDGGTR